MTLKNGKEVNIFDGLRDLVRLAILGFTSIEVAE